MKAKIGSVVVYELTADDAWVVNRRREHAASDHSAALTNSGAQVHAGNSVMVGEIVPMIVTAVWPENRVNGQCLLDGSDSLWVTSADGGVGPGRWRWSGE